MANIEIPSYKRVTKTVEKEEKREISVPKIGIDEIIVGIAAFLMSRVMIINSMSPFGAAFFASGYKKRTSVFSFIGVCLGILTVRQDLDALKYITAMTLFSLIKLAIKKESIYKDASAAGGTLFFSGFLFSLAGYMLTYDLLVLALESFVCGFFVLIFKAATDYINNKRFFSYIANEQLLSLTFVIALSLSGLGKTVNVGYFNLCEILCSVIVMILAWGRGGALGACGGVVAGVVCALGEENMMNVVGVYALCGFAAGCVRNTGKVGVCAGFLLSGSCAVFLSSSGFIDTSDLLSMILGSGLFAVIPKKMLDKIKAFLDGVFVEPDEIMYVKKAREYISGRLKGLIKSYDRLSEAVAVDEELENKSGDVLNKAAKHVARSVCAKCGMKNMCWEKQKTLTLGALEKVSGKAIEDGYVAAGDFPKEFRNKCINFNEFFAGINHYYSMQRACELWQKQIMSSRAVISEQYKEFSKVLGGLKKEFSCELSGKSGYENKLEIKIFNKLSNMGYDVLSVCVREAGRGYFYAEIEFSDSEYKKSKDEVVQVVSEILDIDMNIVSSKGKDGFVIVLEPVYRFYPQCASASVKKSKSEENGDNIVKEILPESRFFMAVSDGMGTGYEAAVKSRKTNEMLCELIRAKYSPSRAVKMVNAALTSGGGEVFTTVDMAVVDLISGDAEFIKIGAMPSVIIREKSSEAVFAPNLPIGILDTVNVQAVSKKLKRDDVVIMFSDGVCDIKKGVEWIAGIAGELKGKKPDEICEVVLKEAIIRNHGKIKDDMSVIVFKLKENL